MTILTKEMRQNLNQHYETLHRLSHDPNEFWYYRPIPQSGCKCDICQRERRYLKTGVREMFDIDRNALNEKRRKEVLDAS